MRVTVDIRPTLGGAVAGVGRYTVELIRALHALGADDLELRMWFAGRNIAAIREQIAPELLALGGQVPILHRQISNALMYRRLPLALWSLLPSRLLPRLLPGDTDLFHAPFWPIPRDCAIPMVLTIHDFIGLSHPQWVTPGMRSELQAVRRAAPQARLVMTDSEATRNDVLNFTRCDERRVRTVHLGVSDEFLTPVPDSMQREVCERHGLDRPFIVSLCTLEPRKNLAKLIDAYDLLCEREGVHWDLVLIGNRGWGKDEVSLRLARRRPGRIKVTGFLPRQDLPALLSAAAVMGYVSLCEGFGLPPLEAMACGCPVVTSNVSSLPEVVGDAGIMVDPHDTEAVAEGLGAVLTDASRAADLATRGRKRAQEFTWAATARKVLDIYREAFSG